eukprot:jgi/Bigna1/66577/fgenesh1_pg.1_\
MGNTESGPSAQEAALKSRGINRMHPHIQRKLRQGTGYNMKIVIRGGRETGKTSLLRRLEGKSFVKDHIPTPQIQVAHIDWNYKTTSDLVQVEVWDVVDKGTMTDQEARIRSLVAQGKLSSDALPKTIVADASTVDVYKGCHAILMLMDPTRKWTFDYVKEELKKTPQGCQILLMANFRDLHTRREVTEVQIENFLRSCEGNVNYIECCMMNGYGLKQLYNWLNIPFLLLKQDSLKHELERATQELKTAQHEAQLVQEQDYESYLKLVNMQMALANRPPIPAQGPIPKSQQPGLKKKIITASTQGKKEREEEENKGAAQRRGTNATNDWENVPRNTTRKTPSPAKNDGDRGGGGGLKITNAKPKTNPTTRKKQQPATHHRHKNQNGDDDDLDNFNPGELAAGFFGEDDDDEDHGNQREQETAPFEADDDDDQDGNVDDDDEYIKAIDDDEDDDDALEEHEAIQTNAYAAMSKNKQNTEKKDGADDDNDDEEERGHGVEREEVLKYPSPTADDDDDDDKYHEDDDDDLEDAEQHRADTITSSVQRLHEGDDHDNDDDGGGGALKYAAPPGGVGHKEESNDNKKTNHNNGGGGGDDDDGEDDDLDNFSPDQQQAVAKTHNEKLGDGNALKGFYSDNDDDDDDDIDRDNEDDRKGRSSSRFSQQLQPESDNDDDDAPKQQPMISKSRYEEDDDDDDDGADAGGYGEFSEFKELPCESTVEVEKKYRYAASSSSSKPAKKKKKKKKEKNREDDDSSAKKKKKKKKKKKSDKKE